MHERGLTWLLDAGLGDPKTEGRGEVERETAAK